MLMRPARFSRATQLRAGASAAAMTLLLVLSTTGHSTGTPAAPENNVDSQLIAIVHQKASTVLSMVKAAANTMDLSAYISVPPDCPPPPTNVTEVVQSRPPEPPPVFDLHGVSFSNQRALALLNNRWQGVGDLVSSNGIRISEIGSDRVVLVDRQGLRKVVTLYRERK